MAAYGGMERHLCSLAVAAAAEGHSVRLVTTSNSLGPELREELGVPGIELRELGVARGSAGKTRKLAWLLVETLRARMRSWDVIYTNGQSALARTVWSAAGKGTRVVHHHHTAADGGEQATWSSPFRAVLRRAPELVGCSEATRDALNAAAGRDDARFLPYLTRCPVDASEVPDRAPHTPLRFGFCGRLIPEKGIDLIVRLAAEEKVAHGIEWHIHGAGAAYPAEFFEGEGAADIPRRVSLGGRAQTRAAGAGCAGAFLHAQRGDAAEFDRGMSAGLPLVASDRGGTRELARSTADTVIVPADADFAEVARHVGALAEAIRGEATSRRRQRAVYDDFFAPAVVSRRWLDYFTRATTL